MKTTAHCHRHIEPNSTKKTTTIPDVPIDMIKITLKGQFFNVFIKVIFFKMTVNIIYPARFFSTFLLYSTISIFFFPLQKIFLYN